MQFQGCATGIGSLPFTDATRAVNFVLRYVPKVPFWPQLPKRDIREGMVTQFTEGMPCVRVTADGIFFDERDRERELEIFYSRIIAGQIQKFAISADYAQGIYALYKALEEQGTEGILGIKCQITGPFTVAASINNSEGTAILHDEVFKEVIVKSLVMKAQWQIKYFSKFNKPIIVFVDEPYLTSFGSAFTPLNREQVVTTLAELAKDIISESVTVGVHCCGNTDWSLFTEIESIGLISFDAYGFWDKLVLYAENINSFLRRGGILCWGIVPTTSFSEGLSVESLYPHLEEALNALVKKGISRQMLFDQLMVSPSCGCGGLSETEAERVFTVLQKITSKLSSSP
ncbi:MAG: hypothetical protein N2606_01365 [Candidatus Omnitrophica bacterium]|nr:hypothetical protein [Candidatus Omnitrophota bacterium]